MCFMGEKNIAGFPPLYARQKSQGIKQSIFRAGGTLYLLKTNDATIKKLTRAAYRLCRIQSPSHISEDETESFHYVSYSLQYDLVL